MERQLKATVDSVAVMGKEAEAIPCPWDLLLHPVVVGMPPATVLAHKGTDAVQAGLHPGPGALHHRPHPDRVHQADNGLV